jgi:amino acid transporter/mannitol/fructose-specific phosphotransferase system IIA component (Ntr-type)
MAILQKSKRLKKELSLFNVYAIATGVTIASGFFLLPGIAFAQAGPAIVLSYMIAAIPLLPGLLSTAELSTAMPRAGGVYYFLDRSMGPLMGTIGGLGSWLALTFKAAFALVGIGAYVHLFLPQIQMLPLETGFAVLFGIINFLGAKKSGVIQSVFVIGLLLVVGWFIGSGIPSVNYENFNGIFSQDLGSVFATAGLVYVSYVGVTKIASISEEVKNPERNIPLGMFLALATALIIYITGTYVMVGVIPAAQLSNNITPVATATDILVGNWGVILVTVAAIVAFFSVANAGILSASRYPLAMSRDHLVPSLFRVLTKNQIPQNSIIITVVLIMLSLIFFDAAKIAKLASSFQLLLFAMNCLAVIIMRESHIESYDPGFRSPLYPWMQIFGILAPIWLIIEMGWLSIIFSSGIIVIGTLWYYKYARHRVVRDGAIYHIFSRLGERRFEGLDRELRGILKEKGLREEDPFDMVIASATIIDSHRAVSFEEVVHQAAVRLSHRVPVAEKLLIEGFMQGTRVGATPISHGAALPHLRLPDIDLPQMVIVRVHKGVLVEVDDEFLGENASKNLVYAFFFLLSPEINPGQHLRILAQIAGHVDDEDFVHKWLAASNEQEMKEILLRDDRYISLVLSSKSKTSPLIGHAIRELNLPEGSLIALIHRHGEILIPKGKTILKEGDRLTIIGYRNGIQVLYDRYTDHA